MLNCTKKSNNYFKILFILCKKQSYLNMMVKLFEKHYINKFFKHVILSFHFKESPPKEIHKCSSPVNMSLSNLKFRSLSNQKKKLFVASYSVKVT